MNKNHRQPYAVALNAGAQTSASSWGTGRAVSRIPRVAGGGTHRSGQGAFGNMCRGGRMFGASRTWRRWNRKISKQQRRYAVCAAIAASGVVPLVMARGHHIQNVPEIPLVIADGDIASIGPKTKNAVALYKKLGVNTDFERVLESRKIRAGKGKARNRRIKKARGPLIVHDNEKSDEFILASRNILGADLTNVTRLNLLQLAPGGHLGRFLVFTESAFKKLDSIFGTATEDSTQKVGYRPPRNMLTNCDISRIIQSEEIQSTLKTLKKGNSRRTTVNPLTNIHDMIKLDPYTLSRKNRIKQRVAASKVKRAEKTRSKRNFLTVLKTPAIAPVRSEEEKIIALLGK